MRAGQGLDQLLIDENEKLVIVGGIRPCQFEVSALAPRCARQVLDCGGRWIAVHAQAPRLDGGFLGGIPEVLCHRQGPVAAAGILAVEIAQAPRATGLHHLRLVEGRKERPAQCPEGRVQRPAGPVLDGSPYGRGHTRVV